MAMRSQTCSQKTANTELEGTGLPWYGSPPPVAKNVFAELNSDEGTPPEYTFAKALPTVEARIRLVARGIAGPIEGENATKGT